MKLSGESNDIEGFELQIPFPEQIGLKPALLVERLSSSSVSDTISRANRIETALGYINNEVMTFFRYHFQSK